MELHIGKHKYGVRLSYSDLFTSRSFDGDANPAWKANFLINLKDPGCVADIAAIEAMIEKVAKDKWGAKADTILKELRSKDKICLHDGNLKADDGYEGHMYLSARTPDNGKNSPPNVFRQVKDEFTGEVARKKLTPGDGLIWDGCYVYAIVDIYAQDNNFGKRVNAALKGVLFVREGEAFGGGRPADAEAFEDIGFEDEALPTE